MAFLEENCLLDILTDDILEECHPFVCGDDDMDEILIRKKELEEKYDAKIYISRYRGRKISSTMIRENPEEHKELIPEGTYRYIREHGLYGSGQ